MRSQKIIVALLIMFACVGLASLCSARSDPPFGHEMGNSNTFTLEVVQHYSDSFLVVMDTRTSKLKVLKFDPDKLHQKRVFSDSDLMFVPVQ